MERTLVKRIDVGEDSILIYECGGRTSLVVTTQHNGDAEILLDVDECESVANVLRTALERDRSWDVWRLGELVAILTSLVTDPGSSPSSIWFLHFRFGVRMHDSEFMTFWKPANSQE